MKKKHILAENYKRFFKEQLINEVGDEQVRRVEGRSNEYEMRTNLDTGDFVILRDGEEFIAATSAGPGTIPSGVQVAPPVEELIDAIADLIFHFGR